MQNIYESGAYEVSNPTWHEEDSPWKAQQIRAMLDKHGFERGTICEIGCGTGVILRTLEAAYPGSTLSGFEVSPQAYDRARLRETDATRFYLSEPPTTPGSFDVVLMIDVIEHVPDYIGFIEKFRRVGKLTVFHIPLDISVQSIARGKPLMALRRSVGHLHYFTKDSAIATLSDCGYEVVDFCYTGSRLELPNQAWTSTVMRYPRKLFFGLDPDLAVRILGGYSLLVLAK